MPGAGKQHVDHVLAVVEGGSGGHAAASDPVLRSWIRSANTLRVDPNSREAPRVLTSGELRYWRDAESELVSVARPELDRLYRILRPTRYVILLCDRNGVVIDHRGDEAQADEFRRWGVWLGGVWSEAAEGTNGIGTCIAERRPITVHRSQHFRARHIELSCSGAPIRDAEGELVGVLDVSSIDPELSERSHALTGALTIATARAIEERLFRKRFHRNWILTTGPAGDPAVAMLFAVDNDLGIVGAGPVARPMLARRGHARWSEGLGLWAVFERDDTLFRHPERGDAHVELTPLGEDTPWPAIITPPTPPLARPSVREDMYLSPRLDALALRKAPARPLRGGLPPAVLARVRAYIDANLSANIELETLAAEAGLSLFHFARAFKQSEGVTPHRYVLERRVAKARELLSEDDESLAAIALAVGFADQSHFARRFREIVGVSPGEFRRLRA